MLTEEFVQKRIEKLGYFNEYVWETSDVRIFEASFLLDYYFSFDLEEQMENLLTKELENLGFSVSYLHCYTKIEAVHFDLFEEKMVLAAIEKEEKEEEILIKYLVSHKSKVIRRLYCDNVYAPEDLVDEIAELFEKLVFKQKRLKYAIEQYEVISKIPED